jgi:hypothetical protein
VYPCGQIPGEKNTSGAVTLPFPGRQVKRLAGIDASSEIMAGGQELGGLNIVVSGLVAIAAIPTSSSVEEAVIVSA